MDIWTVAVLFGGGTLAGAISATAGGSSFITFPLLLSTGLPPFPAAITNYIALIPSNAVALLGYHQELARVRHKLPIPLTIAAVGGSHELLFLAVALGTRSIIHGVFEG